MNTKTKSYEKLIFSEWNQVFVVIPKKTISGVYKVGSMNRRVVKTFSHVKSVEHPFGGELDIPEYDISYQYATDKEVFLDTLGGKDAVSV